MNTQLGKATTRRVRIATVGAALLLACSHPTGSALAQSLWGNPGGSIWGDPRNWSTGVLPNSTDTVEINYGGKAFVDEVYTPLSAAAQDLLLDHMQCDQDQKSLVTNI